MSNILEKALYLLDRHKISRRKPSSPSDVLDREREFDEVNREAGDIFPDIMELLENVFHENKQGIDFNSWLSSHPCTKDDLWKMQNMLGSCLPNSQLYRDALESWKRN